MPLTLFTRKPPPPDSRAVPIVLGVTGHRDVRQADVPRLRQAVSDIIKQFTRYYRHTPLVLLSSLAQGADQLCATVALEKGLQVIAPLPFPAALYLQSSSFDSDEARLQCEALLKDPRVTAFVTPLPAQEMPSDDTGWARLLEADGTRHRCYANAGGYVVLHCHALIALWDGEESEASAGTAQMVQFKRTGRPPEAYPWTQPLLYWADSGPVYVVHTPRTSAPGARGTAAGSRDVRYPAHPGSEGPDSTQSISAVTRQKREKQQQKQERRQFRAMCRSVNRFNRRLRASPPASEQEVITSLLGKDVPPVPEDLSRLGLLRTAAAALSRPLADWLRWLTLVVFGLIWLAALTFHLYAHPLGGSGTPHAPLYLWAFIGLLFVAFSIVKGAQFRHLERQALDYRALAEALRVQIYWLAGGMSESVAASYLQQMRSEMSWIRQAVRACSLRPYECCDTFAQLSTANQLAWLDRVGQHWLEGQRTYYDNQHAANHQRYTRSRRWGLSLAVLGWLLALTLVVGDLWPGGADRVLTAVTTVTQSVTRFLPSQGEPGAAATDSHAAEAEHHGWSASEPPHWLLVLSGTLVVAGGLCIAYIERRAFEELTRQYSRMYVLFVHSIDALQLCLQRGDVAAAQRVLRETGCEALTESASWLILRRARRFELPVH